MIDIERTIKKFGYDPRELPPTSHKKVWFVCSGCLTVRFIEMKDTTRYDPTTKGRKPVNYCRSCTQIEASKKRAKRMKELGIKPTKFVRKQIPTPGIKVVKCKLCQKRDRTSNTSNYCAHCEGIVADLKKRGFL